jgi:hypothetical protein
MLTELIFLDEALNLQQLVKSDPDIEKLAATVATARFNQYVPGKNGQPFPIVNDDNRLIAFVDALRAYIKKEVLNQRTTALALLKKTAMLQPPKAPTPQPVAKQPPPLPTAKKPAPVSLVHPRADTVMA